MRDTILWRLRAKECAWIDCDTKYEWISDMKITKTQLKQIIKEELDDSPWGKWEDEEYPNAPWDEDELSFEDKDRFVEAYKIIGEAVENGTLPESVEDAFNDMLYQLGIYL
jgi:hypothetical protein